MTLEKRSEVQRSIDTYGPANVPKNASLDALHADHVYSLTEDELHRNDTPELWINQMHRLRTVVCVTAKAGLLIVKSGGLGDAAPPTACPL